MGSLFTPSYFQPVNSSGIPLAGAKLYFYQTGTTTLITVYQDDEFSTPRTNPVVADASGTFPPTYVDRAEFKVVLKDASDVTIQTVDPAFTTLDADAAGFAPDFATITAAQAYAPVSAPDYIRTAGYTTAGDGGGALYKKVASEPSHAGKFSITLDDGVTVVWYEIAPEDGVYRAAAFGLVSDLSGNDGYGTGTVSGADQATALQGLLDAAPSGSTIDFADYEIRFNSDVTISDKDIRFTGKDWLLYGDGAMLTVEGSRTELTYISASVSAGARTATMNDASGISAGDVLILHNTNSQSFYGNSIDGRDYTDGEFIEVESVSSNTVTFKTLTKTAYAGGAAFKVFKVDLVDVAMGGGTIEGSDGFVLNLVHCTNLDLKINVYGGLTRALYVNQCYRGYIPPGGRFIHKPAVLTGNNYGISFSNSQDILVEDVFAFGSRHGIAMGGAPGDGAVPCRNIVVRRSRISSDQQNLHAADIHGWAVECYYENCDVDGSLGIGGLNCGAPGCTVVDKRTDNPGRAIALTEIVGGTIDLRNIKVRYAPGALAQNVFGVAASAQFGGGIGVRDYNIILDGLEVECISGLTRIISFQHNMPGSVRWNLSANDMKLSGDISGLDSIAALTVSNTESHASAPIAASRVSLENVMLPTKPTSVAVFRPSLSGGVWANTRFTLTETVIPLTLGSVHYLSSGDAVYKGKQTESIAVTTASGNLFVSAQRVFSLPGDFIEVESAAIGVSIGFCVSVVADIAGVTYYAAHTASGTVERTVNFTIEGKWFEAA